MKFVSKKEVNTRIKRIRTILPALKKLFPRPKTMLQYSNHWELLVAVILSAQCTDKKVNEVTETLFKKYKTLKDYLNADRQNFEKDIKSTGFYRNKTKNVLNAAKVVASEFGGELPKTIEDMQKIPGVGRKTANVVLGNAYGIVLGIAVDTHVKRLTRLWGLSREQNPEKIEADLMSILPKKEWFLFTYRTIEYGRKYCTARTKNHEKCPLGKFEYGK